MNTETSTVQGRQYGWPSGINILLGVWIIISPFVLGFQNLPAAVWNNVIVGILVGLFALIRSSSSYSPPGWSWCNVVLGAWLIISSFVLGFVHTPAALLNNLIAGVVIGLLALSRAVTARPTKAARPTAP